MKKVHVLAGFLASFCSGVAFVVACDHGDLLPLDAGESADAAECTGCESPITSERLYRARRTSTPPSDKSSIEVDAVCNDGDVLLGGGCWIYEDGDEFDGSTDPDTVNNDHELIISGPWRLIDSDGEVTGTLERWYCVYDNRELRDDLVAEATAICFDVVAE